MTGEHILIENAGGSLCCEAIGWEESQNCNVAVRNVPTKSGGAFVDTGTYVLKNRQLNIRVRLSTADKTTLQNIFNQSALVTITAKTIDESYPRWVYTAWLVKKPLSWEYRVLKAPCVESNIVRWWTVELNFVCSTFEYIVSGEEEDICVCPEFPAFISTHCPNEESTSSVDLVDDPSAILPFTLEEPKIVFVTYSSCNYHGVSSDYHGKKLGIKVDDNDVAMIETSPHSSSYANGGFVFWIGQLGAGIHVIKGRFASITGGTVRISERRLLIVLRDLDEVSYYFKRSTIPITYTEMTPPPDVQSEGDPSPITEENILIESPHPYPNNYDNTWTETRITAQCMRFHFTYIKTEAYYDFVYAMDGSDVVYMKRDGHSYDLWSPWISGNTIKVRLTSDGSVVDDGFIIDKLQWSTSPSPPPIAESPHPYPPNYDNTWIITRSGAQCIRLHFAQLKTESYSDHIYLKDQNDTVIKDYTGDYGYNFWSPWVIGNTAKLRLTSNGSVEYYGFLVDKIEYSYTGIPDEFIEDSEAKFQFNLSSPKKALILYSACNYHAQEEHEYGKKILISVDGIKGTALGSSPYYINYADSEFIAEIRSLGSGNHTIKGMFAPNEMDQKVTVNERQFGILLFPSTLLTNFIESSTQVSQTGSELTDDTETIVQRTIIDNRCILIIYCAGKKHGTVSSYAGKKVAININGIDYTLNAQSSYYNDSANTTAIQSDVIELSAGIHTIKGRFASNSDNIAKVDERKLCVLWFTKKPIAKMRVLKIEKQCEGSVEPSVGTYIYWKTKNISVLATPAMGWIFDYWELDGINVGSANPYTVQTDEKHTLKAYFANESVSSVQPFGIDINGNIIGHSSQRRLFYKDGYYCLFHHDVNGDTVYKVSTDKLNWTKPTTGNPVALADDTCSDPKGDSRGVEIEYFGGTKAYVVVARNAGFSSSGYTFVKIKEGTISSGEITWGDWVTIIYKTWSSAWYWSQFILPSLCRGSDGYLWLIVKVLWENSYNATWYMRSQNPDDISSWHGPYHASYRGPTHCQNVPLQITDGCYQMDKDGSGYIWGRTMRNDWTAGSWEQITTYETSFMNPCALSTPDGTIHFLYVQGYGGWMRQPLRYRKRVNGVWQTEEVLVDEPINNCALSYIDGVLYAIYSIDDGIYYLKCENGIWSNPIKIICGEDGGISTTRTLPQLTGFMVMWTGPSNMIRVMCK